MKTKLPTLFLATSLLVLAGCSSNDVAAATPEQKKAFGGSAPPADYMKNIHTGPPAGIKTGPATGGK